MPNYQKMYTIPCAGMSKVLDDMEGRDDLRDWFQRLKALLNEAEDVYIDTAE